MGKNVSQRNYDLHLQHKDYENHNEYWLVKDGRVEVLSICSHNVPERGMLDYSKDQALRQFALLTSHQEGWKVVKEFPEWHRFIEDETEDKREVSIVWSTEDVMSRAQERSIVLTEEQAIDIIGRIKHSHDASIGVNWDVIDFQTDEHLKDQKILS